MVDWSDSGFLQALLISVIGVSISIWWLSTRILSKIEEIEERKSSKKSDDPPKSD